MSESQTVGEVRAQLRSQYPEESASQRLIETILCNFSDDHVITVVDADAFRDRLLALEEFHASRHATQSEIRRRRSERRRHLRLLIERLADERKIAAQRKEVGSVVRMADLTGPQRKLILALIDAQKAADKVTA